MKNNNYPNWLVPIEIAKELKEIGFNEPCHFYYQNDYSEYLKAGDPDKYHIISDSLTANRKNANHNKSDIAISAPTWEQVFEWFREKGLYSFLRVNIPDLSVSYFIYDKDGYIEENGHRSTYKDAQNDCVEELIKIYKENE
nr:MAG TPA: hypothetical protein [Caudoviricetes sp.]